MDETPPPQLGPQELAPLRRQDNHHSALHLAGVAAAMLAAFAIGHAAPHPLVHLPAALLIGGLLHHLLVAQQEALQYLLFRDRRLNDVAGDLAAALLLLTPQQRWARWHGRGLLDEGPPRPAPARTRLLVGLLIHLSGLAAVGHGVAMARRHLASRVTRTAGSTRTHKGWLRRMLLWQGLVAAALLLLVGWQGYVGLWLVPRLCVLPALVYLRDAVGREPSLCTVRCSLPEGFFLAPMNAGFGAERHLCSGVPWHALPRCHRLLSGRPGYADQVTLRRGYLRSLWRGDVGPVASGGRHSAAA